MSYAKGKIKRSSIEKVFLVFFFPSVILGYLTYKYPDFLIKMGILQNVQQLYFFGKHPSFWYSLIYTGIVCYIAGKVLIKNKSPYKKGKKNQLSPYQRYKFLSIFLSQFILFFVIPYIIPPLMEGRSFFADPMGPIGKNAYIYVSRGFTSLGGAVYIFLLVPLSVWIFGKRYCSWFCACGNLAETIGITKWGSQWVKFKTPSGKLANKMENLQTIFLGLGITYGIFLFLKLWNVFSAPNILDAFLLYQDFIVDFVFGALIGICAYPLYGTRIWCRYGCPLAKFMEIFGRHAKSKFKVAANDKCKGLDLCSQVCPMGIDVAAYAHKDKKPILGSFGLETTPCIGCGGCVDICPVNALEFVPIKNS
jgi:ferredoxin-type protein NapH